MDLDFPVHTTGRSAAPPPVEIIGEVEQADLELLKVEGRPSGQTPHLQRLSDRHHSVARLLALGHAPWEVSAITGYDPSRIAILQNDPTFKHLLACYREAEGKGVADLAARVRDAAATAVTKVLERLEDDPTIEFSDLSRATRDLLDRAGHGPKSTKELNINVGLAERVELARQRALKARSEAPPMALGSCDAPPMTDPPMLELEATDDGRP